MKHSHRSVAAVLTATLVGGAGLAAVVTGISGANGATGTQASATRTVDTAQRSALSVALRDLAHGTDKLDRQLRQARHELVRQNRALHEARAVGRAPLPTSTTPYPAVAPYPSTDSAGTPPTADPAPPPEDEPGDEGEDDHGDEDHGAGDTDDDAEDLGINHG